MAITGEDPTYTPSDAPGLRERTALRFINDPRDTPFLGLIALLLATVVASGVLLYVPGVFRWWLGIAHVALVGYFLGPFILMLHNTSHRRFFKRSWAWMNYFIPWVIGPFFGESPETYFAHHVGMHHPENNLEGGHQLDDGGTAATASSTSRVIFSASSSSGSSSSRAISRNANATH